MNIPGLFTSYNIIHFLLLYAAAWVHVSLDHKSAGLLKGYHLTVERYPRQIETPHRRFFDSKNRTPKTETKPQTKRFSKLRIPDTFM